MQRDLYLGADVGGTALKFVLTDSAGEIHAQGDVATDSHSARHTIERLGEATIGMHPRLRGVGLACAGIVDPVAGTLGRAPNLPGWEDSNLAGAISAVFPDLPVALANDVNGALYGEYRSGAGRGCENLVMLALGTGVGGGVLVDGQLVIGAQCGAGEIGHIVLDLDGPPCPCGNRGCLEAWAGARGVLRAAREIAGTNGTTEAFRSRVAGRGESLTPRDLSRLADEGDATAVALYAEVGRRLGQGIGNLVNVLDPDRVIVGGGLAAAGHLFLDICRTQAAGQILSVESKNVPIVPAELGPHAAAIGAAWLAREAENQG